MHPLSPSAYLSPDATPQERVFAFKTITSAGLSELERMCVSRISNYSLAVDGFAHALAKAYEHWDGRSPLQNYLITCTRNYALSPAAGVIHRGPGVYEHVQTFTDLERADADSPVEQVRDGRDDFAPATTLDSVEWYTHTLAILRSMESDPQLTKGTRLKAQRALRLLVRLAELVDADADFTWHDLPELARQTLAEGREFSHATVEATLAFLRRVIATALPAESRSLLRWT